MKTTLWLGLYLSSLGACGANETPKPTVPAALGTTSQAPVRVETKGAVEPQPQLDLRVVRSNAGVGLRIINAGAERVSLSGSVSLTAAGGETPAGRPGQTLPLQRDCKSTGCVSLAPGAEIDAPAWLERVSGERCGALVVPEAAGDYVLRVQSCGGTHSIDAPFAWPVQ